jgi:hypothetical protein
MISFAIIITCLTLSSAALILEVSGLRLLWVALAAVVGSVAFYSLFLGPEAWDLNAEDPRLADERWISRDDAAQALGVSAFKLTFLIRGEYLAEAANSAGQLGVEGPSIAEYLAWRNQASRMRRMLRALSVPLRML